MATHINSLYVWNTPAASVLNLVVVGDEMEEPQVDGVKLTMPILDQTQQFEVGNKLEQHGVVICTKLGRATDICYTINTGMSQPLRTCPYRPASMDRSVAGGGSHSCGGGHSQTLPQPLVLPHGTSKETRWFSQALYRFPSHQQGHPA